MKIRYVRMWLMIVVSVVVVDVAAMNEHALVDIVPVKEITYKSLYGLPCIPFKNVRKWFCNLSDDKGGLTGNQKRQSIFQQIKDLKDERLSLLFAVATFEVSDIRNKIMQEVCEDNQQFQDYTNGTFIQAHYYPVLVDYVNGWNNNQIDQPKCLLEHFTHEIKAIEYESKEKFFDMYGRKHIIFTKDDLLAIKNFSSAFKIYQNERLHYQYRKLYALDNFKKQFEKVRLSQFAFLLPIWASYCIGFFLPSASSTYIDETIVAENLKIESINKVLVTAIKLEGMFEDASMLPDLVQSIKDPIKEYKNCFFYIKGLAYIFTFPMCVLSSACCSLDILHGSVDNVLIVLELVWGMHLFGWGAFLSYAYDKCLVPMTFITSLCLFWSFLHHICDMRSLQTDSCKLAKLGQLLKNSNINIE
jgi:hypothetical protein